MLFFNEKIMVFFYRFLLYTDMLGHIICVNLLAHLRCAVGWGFTPNPKKTSAKTGAFLEEKYAKKCMYQN